MENQYPICMNLDPETWSALVYLRSLSEDVDPERLMAEALLRAARERGWEEPGARAPK